MKWPPYMEQELLRRVAKYRADGMTENGAVLLAAQEMGISYTSAYQKHYKLSRAFAPVPESRYPTDQPMTFEGPALALGDIQAPYQNGPFINRCILTAQAMGITTVVLGGDNFENAAMSAWPASFENGPRKTIAEQKYQELKALADSMPDGEYRNALYAKIADSTPDAALPEEIRAVRDVIGQIVASFERVIIIQGNHEHRAVRRIMSAIDVTQFQEGLFFEKSPKVQITSNFWVQSTCNGKPWRYSHPVMSSKDNSSKKISPKFHTNSIVFHGHHFSVRSDISGKFVGVEPGMCCDEQKMGYPTDRDNGADQHVTGAAIVNHDGGLVLLNQWMWPDLFTNQSTTKAQ